MMFLNHFIDRIKKSSCFGNNIEFNDIIKDNNTNNNLPLQTLYQSIDMNKLQELLKNINKNTNENRITNENSRIPIETRNTIELKDISKNNKPEFQSIDIIKLQELLKNNDKTIL